MNDWLRPVSIKLLLLLSGFEILRAHKTSSGPSLFDFFCSSAEAQEKSLVDPSSTKEQLVPHPLADKGLVRITSDKTYLYQTPKSDQNHSSSVRFGMFDPAELANSETGVTFSTLYEDSEMPLIMYDYEWQLWRGRLGKLGWKLGTGIYAAHGNGSFKSPENAGIRPRESFTFLALPNNVAAIYRMQIWDKQPLVPFIEGGGDAITFAEIRDDSKGPKFGLATAAHAAGGIAFNLGALDKDALITLDREFGINSVWVAVEYRVLVALGKKFDFSADFLNGGIYVEF